MKPDQVNKLYKQLTPKELATLAIDAIARQDGDEQELIANSVQRLTYECNHMDYIRRLRGFERLALFYGVEYWKVQAIAIATIHYSQNNADNNEINKLLSMLASMESALINVCNQEQINIEAVRVLINYEPLPVVTRKFATPQLISEYTDAFTNLFHTVIY